MVVRCLYISGMTKGIGNSKSNTRAPSTTPDQGDRNLRFVSSRITIREYVLLPKQSICAVSVSSNVELFHTIHGNRRRQTIASPFTTFSVKLCKAPSLLFTDCLTREFKGTTTIVGFSGRSSASVSVAHWFHHCTLGNFASQLATSVNHPSPFSFGSPSGRSGK